MFAYGGDKEAVREAGLAYCSQHREGYVIDAAHPADVWLVQFGDSSLNFELVVWVAGNVVSAPNSTQAKFLWVIETELRNRNIEIPFPQRDLHIRSGVLDVRTVESVKNP